MTSIITSGKFKRTERALGSSCTVLGGGRGQALGGRSISTTVSEVTASRQHTAVGGGQWCWTRTQEVPADRLSVCFDMSVMRSEAASPASTWVSFPSQTPGEQKAHSNTSSFHQLTIFVLFSYCSADKRLSRTPRRAQQPKTLNAPEDSTYYNLIHVSPRSADVTATTLCSAGFVCGAELQLLL